MVCCEQITIESVKNKLHDIPEPSPDIEINLLINNQQITTVYVMKFLGVYIDESLNWKYQINKVRLKLSKVAAVIYKANCLIDRNGIYKFFAFTTFKLLL